jgi:short subunit fatty acids transporter
MVDYVKSIIETAKKTPTGEITEQILSKASSKNLKMNALNWGAGFVTSALFLSTLIPKMQYKIRKWRTGSEEFPGTAQFRQEENNKQLA